MTTYHLNFWSKTVNGTQIERVYVNADDRSSLGYFEMRVTTAARGSDTYYDAHRLAKGDTTVETGRSYGTTLPSEAATAIYAAVGAKGDDFDHFRSVKDHARGVSWIPYPAKTSAGRAERKQIKARQTFTIDL